MSIEALIGGLENRFPEPLSSTEHRSIIGDLLRLYDDRGLLPVGRDAPLNQVCRHRKLCWEGAEDPACPERAGISVPWIGRRYFDSDSKVAMVGINLHDYGGLAAHYEVCTEHIAVQEANGPGKNGEIFGRGAMQYLRLILASLDGQPIPDPIKVQNRQLAELWERMAFLEAVKCAPGVMRSKPTEAMLDQCPKFLLRGELEVLTPSVVVILGRTQVRDKVRPWAVPPDGYGRWQHKSLERDVALIEGRRVELISVNHPSSQDQSDVVRSLEQLAGSLATDPAGSPPLD